MTILRARDVPVRRCAAGLRRGSGRAGTAGELLGAHDVAVAWICRQRREPPAGPTMMLADTDLLHRGSFALWLPAPVAGSGPCATGAGVRQ